MGALLSKFEERQPLKRDETETAERVLQGNVRRLEENDLVVINAYYWSRYERFVQLVKAQYLSVG
jgi:hypothetical protein